MAKKTSLSQVKSMARVFLFVDPELGPHSPVVIHHPFTDSGIVGLYRDGQLTIGDISTNETDLSDWREQVSNHIDRAETVMDIVSMISNSYKLGFLKYILPYLSNKDMSDALGYIWKHSESPNRDPNLPKKRLVSLFKRADPTVLMDEDEIAQLSALPDVITVYRGVTSYNAQNIRALSWTLCKKTAMWFAKRYGEKGKVYQATISKDHALAYFSGRGENELIVDPAFLCEITMICDYQKTEPEATLL